MMNHNLLEGIEVIMTIARMIIGNSKITDRMMIMAMKMVKKVDKTANLEAEAREEEEAEAIEEMLEEAIIIRNLVT